MRILDFPQGSEEWKAARAGKVTASRVADILATTKGGTEAAARRDYRAQLVAERLTGTPQDDVYENAAMKWGTDQEPFARAAYEIQRGLFVDTVGIVLHPTIEHAAASPDGLVGLDGLLEIKCPKTATHLGYLESGVVPANYKPQMLWQMACCEHQWCDFASYDPRLPDDLQLFVVRFTPKSEEIMEIETIVKAFLAEVEQVIQKLRNAVCKGIV